MKASFAHLDEYRVRHGPYGTQAGEHCGAFFLPFGKERLYVMAGDPAAPVSEGWEHVSVSLATRCPTWSEMCHVKSMFWDKDEVVVQLHVDGPAKVNLAEHCLHLWKPPAGIALPPKKLV